MNDEMKTPTTAEMPIACLLGTGTEGVARMREVAALFQQARAVDKGEDGYLFRFSDDDGIVEQLAGFVVAERRCCPFLTFDLHIGPAGSESTLRLSGDVDVTAFIAATFVIQDA